MELKWIEDFLCLAQTGSFSRSAQLRHITQPAFSRRIRALENWVGTYLIDRASSPASLTEAGEVFKSEAVQILAQVHRVRGLMNGKRPSLETIELALPSTFSLSFFRLWLAGMERRLGGFNCRFVAKNIEDVALSNAINNHSLLMCYYHVDCPIEIDLDHYEMCTIGCERIQPYARPIRGRRPLFELSGHRRGTSIPYLGYAPDTYIYRIVELILGQTPAFLTERYQANTIERLKAMVLEGHGIAFLPETAVRDELERRQLAVAGDERWQMELDIRLYRRRDTTTQELNRVWSYLVDAENLEVLC